MTHQEAIDYLLDPIGKREQHDEAIRMAISALQAQEEKLDTISRTVAIDAVDSEIVSTNPEHFKSSEKFIKFMDDADIASFGKWQWANGFNTAVVAAKIQLENLPPAQPEPSEISDEQAILHLQSTGWMQNHDREMYESGLREQLERERRLRWKQERFSNLWRLLPLVML